jgi:hypothetical protein
MKSIRPIVIAAMLSLFATVLPAQDIADRKPAAPTTGAGDAGSAPTAGMRLEWTHFIGGRSEDGLGWLRAPVLDRDGMLWFTGVTKSQDFPVTPDALDRAYHDGSRQWGTEDVFLVKFNTRQPGVAYSTLLGGAKGPEHAAGLVVNADGTIAIVGNTGSADFPVTDDAFTKQFQGPDFRHADGFLTILGDGGRTLKYSTFIGGGKNDWGEKVFVSPSGELTLFGIAESPGFPSADAVRPAGLKDAPALFVMRLDAKGQRVLSSRVLANSWGTDVQQLDSGDFLIVGNTNNPTFAATKGAFGSVHHGGDATTGGDLFVMRLSADLQTVSFATLFGGAGDESWPRIAPVAGGDFFVVGSTTSKDLPVTADALEKTLENKEALFLARFGGDGRSLKYCTYLGGKGADASSSAGPLVYDGRSRVYVTGTTTSPRYPVTPDALQANHRGGNDAVLLAFNVADNSLAYGSYLGGAKSEWYPFLTFDKNGALYVLGSTGSDDFPTLENPPAPRKGRADVYIAKFSIGTVTAAAATKSAQGKPQ